MASADFDSVVSPHYRTNGPGAAIAVRRCGELIHARGYGLANVEWNAPIELDTVFRIGSITKQFTAAAILKLAEMGKLEIDDSIERHLTDYPVGGRRITVRHLLNHTSGIKNLTELPNFESELMHKDTSLVGVIDVFKDLPPDFEPGEKFNYSNSGYILLGAIIERVSGTDYETFLRDAFFRPLGLESTRYLYERPVTAKRAAGYEQRGRELINATPISMSWPYAAGALGSTVMDLLRWDEALRGGEAVSAASYGAMITPARLNDGASVKYGLGMGFGSYRGQPQVGHNGGINGFVTTHVYRADGDLTVLILSNVDSFPLAQVFGGLVRRALGLPDAVRSPIELDSARLEACAGDFQSEFGPVRLNAEGDVLSSDWPRPGSRFWAEAEDAFYLEEDPELSLRFEDLKDGSYNRLVVEGYGDPVTATRASSDLKALTSIPT